MVISRQHYMDELPPGYLYPVSLKQLEEWPEIFSSMYFIDFVHSERKPDEPDEIPDSQMLLWVHYIAGTDLSINAGNFRMDVHSVPDLRDHVDRVERLLTEEGLPYLAAWIRRVRRTSRLMHQDLSRTLKAWLRNGQLEWEEIPPDLVD